MKVACDINGRNCVGHSLDHQQTKAAGGRTNDPQEVLVMLAELSGDLADALDSTERAVKSGRVLSAANLDLLQRSLQALHSACALIGEALGNHEARLSATEAEPEPTIETKSAGTWDILTPWLSGGTR